MQLRKFIVVKIERQKELTRFISLGTMKPKPRKHQTFRFSYTMTGDDGITYYYHTYHKPKRITIGKTIRCFVQRRTDNSFDISYHPMYKKGLLTPHLFKKAVQDYLERHQKSIAFYQGEIKRLKSLL